MYGGFSKYVFSVIYNDRLFDNRLFFFLKIDCEKTINFKIYDYFHNRPSLHLTHVLTVTQFFYAMNAFY